MAFKGTDSATITSNRGVQRAQRMELEQRTRHRVCICTLAFLVLLQSVRLVSVQVVAALLDTTHAQQPLMAWLFTA